MHVEGTRGGDAGRAAGGTAGRITGRFCGRGKESFRERLDDAAARTSGSSALEPLELRGQHLCGRECGLDEHHLPGPARQRLEAERPRAGEQVEAARAGDRMLQPIEQGLAHPIGCRPKPREIRKVHSPSAPRSTDDAHGAELRAVVGLPGLPAFRVCRCSLSVLRAVSRIIPPGWRAAGLAARGPLLSFATNENEAEKPGVRGFFKRLRAKLNVGPAWLTTDIKDLLPVGRKIDAEILDELETRLITADVGMEATTRILQDLRRRVARKELGDVDALLGALSSAMLEILQPVERPLVIEPPSSPM